MLGQLVIETRLFAQCCASTRKSRWNFWPPHLEQRIKFVLSTLGETSYQIQEITLNSLNESLIGLTKTPEN